MKPAILRVVALGWLCVAPALEAAEKLNPRQFAARIDSLLADDFKTKNITPAPRADDAEFLRRVYLDLAGRIPRVAEVREFLADTTVDKRAKLVERLLASPLYVSHLGTTWRQILLPSSNNQQNFFGNNFKAWIEHQIRDDVAYDRMAHELLSLTTNDNRGVYGGQVAPISPLKGSALSFYQANEFKPENLASNASRIFLGVRLECAQCHDHPFAKWTREQFWEQAAFFTNLQAPIAPPKQPLVDQREIKIPGTDKVVKAMFLDGAQPKWKASTRHTLADWITSPDNPYFARTAVNRVWGHFFGLGLIDPVDDEPTAENPISHPELLDLLREQFIANGHDLKHLFRSIAMTEAYGRTSRQTHPSQTSRSFARMSVRGLTPEQLFDSLALAVGYRDPNPNFGQFSINNGVGLQNPRGEFLSRFANTDRVTEKSTSILQALALMNGKFVRDATTVEKSQLLAAVVESPFLSPQQKIETLFLATLSRQPTPAQMSRFQEYVEREGGNPSAFADVMWALLNSSEFMFNH